MTSDHNELGRLIKTQRQFAGLSMDALARQIGVDRTTIFRMERGDIDAPSPRRLQQIATALGSGVEDYFALAGYVTAHGLPAMAPYLRAKYDLDEATAHEVTAYLEFRRQQHADEPDEPAA